MEIPIKVKIFSKTTKVKVKKGSTIEDLIRKMGFNTETMVAKLNGKIVTEDTEIQANDEIILIRVITGG